MLQPDSFEDFEFIDESYMCPSGSDSSLIHVSVSKFDPKSSRAAGKVNSSPHGICRGRCHERQESETQ